MLMVVAGTTFIGANPDDLRWTSGLAFFFGVGVGLVLDELALARPNSPWARARYRGKPAKIAHARKREAAWAGRKRRIQEFIGGRPTAKRTGSGS